MATEITDMASLQQYLKDHNLGTASANIPLVDPRAWQPFHWKWADIEPAVLASAKLVRLAENFEDTDAGVTRRLTTLVNPRNPPGSRIPVNLLVQCVLPGEQAISHRHSMGATRFVIKGSARAFTLVDGEPLPLEDGDFVTTPHLTFHGHINNSDDYILWLDGLDYAYSTHGARFVEESAVAKEPLHLDRVNESKRLLGGQLRLQSYKDIVHPEGPQVKHIGAKHPPGFRYGWSETSATLAAMKECEYEQDSFDCYSVTYSDPVTGGPTFPTTANEMTMLTPGFRGREHRHNSSTVYYAFRGEGEMVVAGERFQWSKGDFIEVPAWTVHRHENHSGADAYLYSFTDWPAQQALGQFYYEEL